MVRVRPKPLASWQTSCRPPMPARLPIRAEQSDIRGRQLAWHTEQAAYLVGSPDGPVAMVSPETRDRIGENCPDRQLGDAALARGLYADLRAQLVRDPERQYHVDVFGSGLCTAGR
jgi:hypothetical protein